MRKYLTFFLTALAGLAVMQSASAEKFADSIDQVPESVKPGFHNMQKNVGSNIPVTFIHDDLADRTSENLRQECQYILHLTVQCLRPVAKDRHPAGKQLGQYHVLQI